MQKQKSKVNKYADFVPTPADKPRYVMTMFIILLFGTLLGLFGYYLVKDNNAIDDKLKNMNKTADDKMSNDSENNNIINEIDISDWKTYNNSETDFTFKYPKNWEIVNDYFYETLSGSRAERRTVNLKRNIENKMNNWILINQRQFLCDQGKCEMIAGNEIGTYSKDFEVLNVFDQIVSTFKFIEKGEKTFSCGDSTVKDIDGNIYNTVKIGNQCWMKENLKVTKDPEGKLIMRYCLNNNASSCNNDGGLYDWDTAMAGSIKEGAQGICPNDWHVPEDSEWFILENYLKDEGQICGKNRTGWGCDSVGTKIRIKGSSGFEAPFTGYRDRDKYGTIHSWGSYTGFWSSSVYGDEAWYRFIRSNESRILRTATNREYGHAVRCLKN